MGWKCYYSGTLPDIILQEKVIKFIQNSFLSPPDLIVKPYPDIKYDVRVYYEKSVDETGKIHSCCNDFCYEKTYSPWKGRGTVEQIIRDYPCNYFGIIQWCNRKDGTINGGQFIFDRTAGGLLIKISKLFPIYLNAQTENENKKIPEPESMVQINLRGNELYEWPLRLNIIKLRWWPDLNCSDDEDACAEVAHDIWKLGLTKKLMDENLNFNECCNLMNEEHKKYYPSSTEEPGDKAEEPEQEEKISKLIVVPVGIMDWSIAELDLSVRTSRCLEAFNVKTIGDLLQKTVEELLKQKNLGRKSIAELTEVLGEYGLSLKKDEEKRRFKNLTEMNRHILTEKYGKDVANRIIEKSEKLKMIHQASINKFPI